MEKFYCYNCNKEYTINCPQNQIDEQICSECGERIYQLLDDDATISNNTDCAHKVITDKELLLSQTKSLHNIENMVRFFVIIVIINIIASMAWGVLLIKNLF